MVDKRDLPPPATRTEGEGETLDMPEGFGAFNNGQVLGGRYQILEMLGRGGMGEVWQAFDLKLRVEVALKALRPEFFTSERRLEMLREEVRAAREVMSPNVCRIFDLIEIEDRELVSMEYVDGATLLGVLQERGPLDLKEAQDIASQFLAGLEAIHKVGLVHRDIKPENIMLTRAGRVVVMDFGLARQEVEGGGSVSGTPAYMAPEQAAGQQLDARADVYAAGVVLAEMVSPDGIKSYESRQSVWEGVRSEPAQVPDSPWAPVISRAVARDRERRPNSAHTLIRELEDVTLRVEGAEDLHPYPGLASFTEDDAEYFFGREAEVEAMWAKFEGPPRILGLVGPSGAGKSSYLMAGLIPNATTNWSIVRSTPGNAPFVALGQTLASALAGNAEAIHLLPRIQEIDTAIELVALWSRRSSNAVLIVDQFEELFTLNDDEVQVRFAELLARLPLEADVHVLLSMRDDFLMSCNRHEPLRPIVHGLTLLDPPAGASLRRALVHPATKCGYRFEDDDLVDEMLGEVEGERGALPLLAFAAARLWEKRDRDSGLLTRQAYQDIGGVGGALAQHAEATIDRIGRERIPVVRELFRNLVTADGTRAIREWDELLSIFDTSGFSREGINPSPTKKGSTVGAGFIPAREAAKEVLRELIDSRLLTSYEIREEDKEPTRMVEIIHESLLANWPRLVGWQTRDADSARLRDELRQAARTWDEHQRSGDYLWTGTAFREFAVWRENYTGGLTTLEEEFSKAASAYAKRRTRLRRLVTAAAFIVLLSFLGLVGISRQQAIAEANRAEASTLVTLGRQLIETDHTAALAYATAALERSDTPAARRLALQALWAGPPATVLPEGGGWGLAFSPDGRLMATGQGDGIVSIYSRDGGPPITFQGFEENDGVVWRLSFSPNGRLLMGAALAAGGEVRLWETEGWQLVHTLESPEPPRLYPEQPEIEVAFGLFERDSPTVLTVRLGTDSNDTPSPFDESADWFVRRWPLDGGPSELLGKVAGSIANMPRVDVTRGLIVAATGNVLHLHHLDRLGDEPPRVIGRNPASFYWGGLTFDPISPRLAACDGGANVLVWPLEGEGSLPERTLKSSHIPFGASFNPDGSWLAQASERWGTQLWNLRGPAFSEPIRLGVEATSAMEVAFTPDTRWLATTAGGQQPYHLSLWPLSRNHPKVQIYPEHVIGGMRFHASGERIFTEINGRDGGMTIRSLPMTGGAGLEPIVHFRGGEIWGWTVDPLGRFLIVGAGSVAQKIPLDGSAPSTLEGIHRSALRLDPTGRHLANSQDDAVVVHDLETGEILEIERHGNGNLNSWFFDRSGRLVVARNEVICRWDPQTRSTEIFEIDGITFAVPLGDGELFYVRTDDSQEIGPRWIANREDGTRAPLAQVHQPPGRIAFDRSGSIAVSTHPDGEIRVGPLFSEDPHLLLGHESGIARAHTSPDGRWIASFGTGDTMRLWPVPDLDKPPFHTLPYRQLMDKLETLTNLRVVRDDTSHTGYTIEPDFTAYRGWAEVPEW